MYFGERGEKTLSMYWHERFSALKLRRLKSFEQQQFMHEGRKLIFAYQFFQTHPIFRTECGQFAYAYHDLSFHEINMKQREDIHSTEWFLSH